MTGRKDSKTETVDVVVVVNHDDLRAGERGTVELTDTVRGRLDRGYLRLADETDGDPEDTGAVGVGTLGASGVRPADAPPVSLLGVEPGAAPPAQ